ESGTLVTACNMSGVRSVGCAERPAPVRAARIANALLGKRHEPGRAGHGSSLKKLRGFCGIDRWVGQQVRERSVRGGSLIGGKATLLVHGNLLASHAKARSAVHWADRAAA